jgi:hypothetical protein
MANKRKIAGPGRIIDRAARKGKIVIGFDPSPDEMITEARKDKGRLIITICGRSSKAVPIQVSASPKAWLLKLEGAMIPKERLAELEAMITEEQEVHVDIEYAIDDKLPGLLSSDADVD